eukprot:513211_1
MSTIIDGNELLLELQDSVILDGEESVTIGIEPIETQKTEELKTNAKHLPSLNENNKIMCFRDRIGDLGHLSDFSSDISQSHPLRAKQIGDFVNIEDKNGFDFNRIGSTDHIDIDMQVMQQLPYINLFNIATHNTINNLFNHTNNTNKRKHSDSNISYSTPDLIDRTTNKTFSPLKPNIFDVCLLTSSPLIIEGINTQEEYLFEYLHHSLPNRVEIQNCIYDKLNNMNYNIRYGHFILSKQWIENMIHSYGGCKILQIVGLCCNPMQDIDIYPEICDLCEYNDD